MEDTKRKSNRILKVERDFELSRIEGQVMAAAYEHVLPILRAGPGEPLVRQAKADSIDTGEVRMSGAKDRLVKLEVDDEAESEQETNERDLRLVIGRLQEVRERVRGGLNQAG